MQGAGGLLGLIIGCARARIDSRRCKLVTVIANQSSTSAQDHQCQPPQATHPRHRSPPSVNRSISPASKQSLPHPVVTLSLIQTPKTMNSGPAGFRPSRAVIKTKALEQSIDPVSLTRALKTAVQLRNAVLQNDTF